MKYLVFDVDDTLYRRSQPFFKACKDVLEKHFRLDWNALFIRRNFHGDGAAIRAQKGEITMREMYIYRLRTALKEFDIDISDELALEFEYVYQDYLKKISLEDPCDRMLPDLYKRGIPLALITNGPAEHQREKIRTLDLGRWIPETHWFISGDKGKLKPDTAMYKECEELFGSKPSEMWYVGDHYDVDVWGAKWAGWNCIWYNRDRKQAKMPEGETILPDFEVNSEKELEDLIYKIIEE